ncbi:MAG: sugar transferase [Planctomycetes bacterium]|nr:sugar transferase [Planctomycetota bacterium]
MSLASLTPSPRTGLKAYTLKQPVPSLAAARSGKVKVGLDFLAALTILLLTSPLLFLAALFVKLTSRGPVLYSQVRVGHGGVLFTVYKVRTMAHECEKESGIRWSMPGDPRVTWIGKILRRSHIDELPQLWNVLRGEMSLVGPRPERPEFMPPLERALPRYRDRLLVRPGITGLAQVQLPPDTDLHSVRRKLAHDLHYVENLGFWLDFRILLGTLFHLLAIPGRLTRAILQLPGGEAVESVYDMPSIEAPERLSSSDLPSVDTPSINLPANHLPTVQVESVATEPQPA